jgi:hypothetical protein
VVLPRYGCPFDNETQKKKKREKSVDVIYYTGIIVDVGVKQYPESGL